MIDLLKFNLSFPKFGYQEQFSFEKGLHVIYGESSCGKSALINQILGQKQENENFDLEMIQCPGDIQKVFQNPDTQIVSSTVDGELAFTLECRNNDPSYIANEFKRIKEELFYNCEGNRHPATLSGGEKEMLNISTAFSVYPKLVLIDDGLSFLNQDRKMMVVDYINKKVDESSCIVLWLTSDCSDLQFGTSMWELNLQSLYGRSNEVKPLPKVVLNTVKNELVLNCKKITFDYNGQDELFKDLDLHIDGFRALGIAGTNGSGKTTLAKLMLGIEQIDAGSISITKNDHHANLAYLEQFPEKMIGADSLATFVHRMVDAGKLDKLKINHAINNLKHYQIEWEQIKEKTALDLPWSTLRIVLTIWLLNCEYEALILDEPTFGLGHQQVLTLMHQLQLYLKNKYLLIISHDTDFIYTFCDRVYDMDQHTLITDTNKVASDE